MAPERPGPEDEPGLPAVHRGSLAATAPLIPEIPPPNSGMQLKEGDGASKVLTAMKAEKTAEDDDLTSLTWLQDKNLLRGMNFQAAVGEPQESPTSDYVDDSASEVADSTSSSGHSPSPGPATVTTVSNHNVSNSKQKHPQHMPYDPLVHVNSKPPYSFSCLIFMAIEDSPHRALPVKEIYAWILKHFPYFSNAPTGWKNSVRHNLSLNKCFRKVEKAPNLGKGSLWMVDPLYRPNLLQALQRAPFHPYTRIETVSMASNKVQLNSSSRPLTRNEFVMIKANSRLPNPDLFPYLSRRLAASGVEGLQSREMLVDSDTATDDADSLDDVDAAAVMLALKHGPRMIAEKKDEWCKRRQQEEQSSGSFDLRNPRKKIRASKNTQDEVKDEAMIPVITTSPSEDHTYSAGPTSLLNTHSTRPTALVSSPDEAFEEGFESDESSRPGCLYGDIVKCELNPSASLGTSTLSADFEEQRKIAEGADALLNLAGIMTRKQCAGEYNSPVGESAVPSTRRSSARGRRRGAAHRPRMLRAARPHKKKNEPARQRGNNRRKSSHITINNNNNNNNNNNVIMSTSNTKLSKHTFKSSSNTNENEWVRHSRNEEKLGRTKR